MINDTKELKLNDRYNHEFYHWFFFDSPIIISIIKNMDANGYRDGKLQVEVYKCAVQLCAFQFVGTII